MKSAKLASILQSVIMLRDRGEPIRVHGSSPASKAWILCRLAEQNSRWVVVCESDDVASELAQDIESLFALFAPESGKQVFHLPTWEQSPYSPIAPSIRTRLSRLETLTAIRNGNASIVVTTLAGSFQATLPPEVFARTEVALKVETSVGTREDLARRFLDAGYLRVETVEDPATFSVRGDLIDIFPPDFEKPLRIELFGDEIDRLRHFDPSTQRTIAEEAGGTAVKEATIGPAREVLITPDTAPGIREKLKQAADDRSIHRSIRDPILASVHEGVYPDHSDTWAPFCYEKPGILWDYLGPDWQMAWDDELACHQLWDEARADQKEMLKKGEVIVPSPEELYPLNDAIETRVLKPRARLALDRLELAPSLEKDEDAEAEEPVTGPTDPNAIVIAPSHRVQILPNTDLASGSHQGLGELETKFRLWLKQGFKTAAIASTQSQAERIRFLLEERGLPCSPGASKLPEPGRIGIFVGTLSAGFRWPAEGVVLITEGEILGTRHKRKKRARKASSESAAKDWSGLQQLSDLQISDAVVHVDHGIGRYQGLVRLNLLGAPGDFLQVEYANKDKLYLPVYRLNVIQKYVGSGEGVVLDRLGSQTFAKAKEKVREAVKKLAFDLIQLYAERKVRPGVVFTPRDSLFREFEAKFPFDETPDQLRAIDDTLADLESGRVMDRLICGDVGYGKTEVAMRAAFKAVSDGKQVVVLVPTTVLAHQHEQSFRTRMKDYPINIASVSRFKSAKEQKKILEDVGAGKIDLIVGTHRLLSKDVKFNDLGLVIIDEEHRFGVEHKEKLKTIKVNTHVMTLTATPIPRTLHMALSGLREISLINTPPVDRLPIRTYVSKFDEDLIKRAIEVELSRGGQVFFVHNRVQSIYEMANRIKKLVPQSQVVVGHGQMAEGELEKTMIAFYEKSANVLVCTSIVESGLDLPSANTILVNRADAFGLAQLYQIRGRVGRGQARAYAYLLLPAEGGISADARKRLEVIQKFVELGSGFSVASHDLEIRGGGDLLGPQQSGHIASVGFDLYTELLEEAIHEIEGKGKTEEAAKEPEIKAPFPAFLSEQYVPDVHQRLSLYRRLSATKQESDLDALEEELKDRFGSLPLEAQNLMWLIRIKQTLKRQGIDALTVGPQKLSLLMGSASAIDPARAIGLVASQPARYQITPDSKFVVTMPVASLRDLFFGLEGLFKELLPRKSK